MGRKKRAKAATPAAPAEESVAAVEEGPPPPKTAKPDAAVEAQYKAVAKVVEGTVVSGTDLSLQIPRLSFGNFGLDVASYGGGPQGRVIMFVGKPKSAKTGSAINTCVSFQQNHCSECFLQTCKCKKRGMPYVLWVDAEGRMIDMLYWPASHGVDLNRFKVQIPPTGQHIVDCVDAVIREAPMTKTGLIIVDSLAHVVSDEELNKMALDGTTIGRNAQLLNSAWRKWTSAINSLKDMVCRPTVICINQLRSKVGSTPAAQGDTKPGGRGQDYVTSFSINFASGPDTFIIWNAKKNCYEAKQKGYKSTFKPPPDATPDFRQIDYRVTASGICPPGRNGQFNYWLKAIHGHRRGDPDNAFMIWNFAKRYLLRNDGGKKYIDGFTESVPAMRTLGELEKAVRACPQTLTVLGPRLLALLSQDALPIPAGEEGEGDGADGADESIEL